MAKRKLIASEIAYLDPVDCGSTVGYTLIWDRLGHIEGTVDLSDCNRHIQWYFYKGNKNSMEKIDKAISVLQNFRRHLLLAKKKKK